MSSKCPKCKGEMRTYSPFVFASKKKNFALVLVCSECKHVKKV